MTVKDLKNALNKYDDNKEVVIYNETYDSLFPMDEIDFQDDEVILY